MGEREAVTSLYKRVTVSVVASLLLVGAGMRLGGRGIREVVLAAVWLRKILWDWDISGKGLVYGRLMGNGRVDQTMVVHTSSRRG